MLNANKASPPAPSTPQRSSPAPSDRLAVSEDRRANGRISLDIPREHMDQSSPSLTNFNGAGSVTPRASTMRMPWSNPKPRPTSMMAFSPPRSAARSRSPPKVMVQSPKSPPKSFEPEIHSPRPSRPLSHAALDSPSPPVSATNGTTKFFKMPSRDATPALDSKPLFPSHPVTSPAADPRKNERPTSSAPPVPPPVNRAGKPKIASKSFSADQPATRATLAPENTSEPTDVSPFSTPPSSSGGSAKGEPSPPTIPGFSKPKYMGPKDGYFPAPPVHHSLADKLQPSDSRSSTGQHSKQTAPLPSPSDLPEVRPTLPARREKDNFDMRKSVQLQRVPPPDLPVRRSFDQSRSTGFANETNNKFMPPPRRTQTATGASFSGPAKSLEPPKPPPPRNSGEMKRPAPAQAFVPKPVRNPTPMTLMNPIMCLKNSQSLL
jgi:hypothetical protein